MINITIDTREQTPWAFPEDIAVTVREKLDEGDYAITGDTGFSIERKSLDDFVGTISSGWERFKRELRRMDNSGFKNKVIIVEGELNQCAYTIDGKPPQHTHITITPQFIYKRVAQLTYDYKSSVLFASNSYLAAGLAIAIFKRRQLEIYNED